MTNMRDAQEALKSVGFSDYEARAYCALLASSPANGYQIARSSGVPRAKVYESLERLVARGAAVQVESSGPGGRFYAPTDFQEMLDDIDKTNHTACRHARRALQRYRSAPRNVEVLWRVTSEHDLITRGRSLTEAATSDLHVAVWKPEFEALLPQLKAALHRGLRLALILYSAHPGLRELQKAGAGAVLHSGSKRHALPIMGRQFVLVADRERCITGSIFENEVEGVFSLNRGLVTNAVDLVNHEIYVERLVSEVGPPIWGAFGKNLEGLDAFDPPRGRSG